MAQEDHHFIGIDLGGTNIQCGLLDRKDKIIHRDGTKTKAEEGSDTVIKRLSKLVDEVIDKSKVDRKDIKAVGIGAPGAIDVKKGVVLNAVNLRWNDFPLAKVLEKELNLPVVVDNDVNVGAWGEYHAGAGKGFDSMLAIFIGTGIGGGLIFDGKLYHGHFCTAGEIGHMVMRSGGGLGRRTLEDLGSRGNIAKQIVQLISTNRSSMVMDLTEGDLSKIRSKIIAQAYKEGDDLTVRVVNEAAHVIGHAAASVVTLLSLPCVVFGGGLTEALGKPLLAVIQKSFEDAVFPPELKACKLVESALEDNAGLVGAAILARQSLNA